MSSHLQCRYLSYTLQGDGGFLLEPVDLSKLKNHELLYLYDRNQNVRRWAEDPLLFARELFPHHFNRSAAEFHEELVGLVFPSPESEGGSKIGVAAPRGFAKSTIVSLLLPIWAITQKRRHFIIISSNTHSQAVKFLQAIKHEFETNVELKRWFPGLRPRKEKWSEQEIELVWGRGRYKIQAVGSGAQLRGFKFLQHRPDLIIIDDGENDEMVESETRRDAYQHWLNHVVLQTNPRAWILKIGTVLHEAALLNRIIRKPGAVDRRMYTDWQTCLYQALAHEGEDEERSVWEEHQSTEDLQAERERDPYGFAQEKQNDPTPPGHRPFKEEYFRDRIYYTDSELPFNLRVSITVDPACSDDERNDETVVTTAGWDNFGRLWVLNEVGVRYANPSDVLDTIFSEYRRWSIVCKAHSGWDFYTVGIEGVAFQRWLKDLFKQRCIKELVHPYITELKADAKKTRRIWRLEPLFRNGTIRLRPDMVTLEHQLKQFPNGAHDDRADALAHQVTFAPMLPNAELADEPKVPSAMNMTLGEFAERSRRHRSRLAHDPYAPVLMSLN